MSPNQSLFFSAFISKCLLQERYKYTHTELGKQWKEMEKQKMFAIVGRFRMACFSLCCCSLGKEEKNFIHE
jgi:hypothetical protein